MPPSSYFSFPQTGTSSRRPAAGFSLVEVILSLGVMAIAIISILGLIAPTLSEVKYTEDLNAGTACIAKMNSLLETAPFWNSVTTAKGETVWQWIADSHPASPTVFLFYDEAPVGSNSVTDNRPVQRVVRFNMADAADGLDTPLATLAINVKDPASNRFPLYDKMDNFLKAVSESRISGPVIAMTLSLSPLAQHFPLSAATGGPYANINEQNFYVAPAQGVLNGLFSDSNFGAFLTDPDGFTNQMPFPEAYLPIFIQCFSIATANLPATASATTVENQILQSFSTSNRLFTYTTAKLR